MDKEQVGRFGFADRAAGLRPQPPAASSQSSIPSAGYECMAYDAHMPSMTARFQVPEGFPLAGGIYRVERIRSATEADKRAFANRPDPIDEYELLDALRFVASDPCFRLLGSVTQDEVRAALGGAS